MIQTNWHLNKLLDEATASYGKKIFLAGEKNLTYAEARRYIQRLAVWLDAQSIGRGSHVMIITQNCAEAVLMALASARIGAVFVILHQATTVSTLQTILGQITPSLVLLDKSSVHLSICFPHTKIVHLGVQGTTLPFENHLPDIESAAPPFPGIDLDPVCLIYTSGSTGQSRGVILSHDNIHFSTAAIQNRLEYRPEDHIGLFVPLSFDYGLYQVFLAMQVGASIYIGQPALINTHLLRTLASEQITILPAVPGIVSAILKLLKHKPNPLPHLRALTNTGEHFPLAHMEQIQQLLPHIAIYPMYGLTECKRVSILLPNEIPKKPGSVGRPLDGTEVWVIDERGNRATAGATGELVVRGRHVTLGYWQAVEETAMRFRSTKFVNQYELYTGDLCRIDDEGYLYVIGRMDNLIKHRGYRISPTEIEERTCQMPQVLAAVVIHQVSTDNLYLFVMAETDEDVIRDYLRQHLEPYKIPEEIRLIAEFPRTPNHKIDRKALFNRIAM